MRVLSPIFFLQLSNIVPFLSFTITRKEIERNWSHQNCKHNLKICCRSDTSINHSVNILVKHTPFLWWMDIYWMNIILAEFFSAELNQTTVCFMKTIWLIQYPECQSRPSFALKTIPICFLALPSYDFLSLSLQY